MRTERVRVDAAHTVGVHQGRERADQHHRHALEKGQVRDLFDLSDQLRHCPKLEEKLLQVLYT